MSESINEDLHKLPIYKILKCARCGRSYPDTILNIEGVIHHGLNTFECLDKKTCKRKERKKK